MQITKQELSLILIALADIFDKVISEELINNYYEVLKEYEGLIVAYSAKRLIRTNKYFPRPAEFIEIIDPAPSGNIDTVLAAAAWADMLRFLQSTTKLSEITDEALKKTINAFGGRHELGSMESKSLQYLRNDFKEMYLAFITPEQKREELVRLGATEGMLRMLPAPGLNTKLLESGEKK
jgi:hypothetical protein